MSKIFDNGIYRELTAEEIAAQEAQEKQRMQPYTYSELVEMFIRERYSLSEELAVLRQRDTKSAEFIEYFEYAESCKSRAKSILQGV